MNPSSSFDARSHDDAHRPDGAPHCGGALREALHLYVDGELPTGEQPALFAHLSACAACRGLMESILQFRRMSRLETTTVPPAADDAFFQRLAAHKERRPAAAPAAPRDRIGAHWAAPMAATAVAFLLLAAVFNAAPASQGSPLVTGEEERVELPEAPLPPAFADGQAIYVFYPGLTVEASRAQEPRPSEAL